MHMVFEQEGCMLEMDMEVVMEPETVVGFPEATLLMGGRPDFEPLPPAGAPVLTGGAGCEISAGLEATEVGGGGGAALGFGASVFGGSVLGGSVLGGSVLGGSVLGGSVFGASVLGASVLGGSLGGSSGFLGSSGVLGVLGFFDPDPFVPPLRMVNSPSSPEVPPRPSLPSARLKLSSPIS